MKNSREINILADNGVAGSLRQGIVDSGIAFVLHWNPAQEAAAVVAEK